MTFPGVTSIIIVSRLTGEIFSGLTNTYLAESLNELKAAALAVLGHSSSKNVDLPPLRPDSFKGRMDGRHSTNSLRKYLVVALRSVCVLCWHDIIRAAQEEGRDAAEKDGKGG